ncbi:hypothetical protein Pyn_40255 [Prunus yedoensis var. nudiflora]|uniref:Uncharacterized protein n=1 Tax=Prunus yedoensis var. nudiflora TaxID=2094558 RepID=A0A314ZU88_PRUYE|nr:hypothetical protein Pyn_40255 [Prunus yedoensis var. nudiflora]
MIAWKRLSDRWKDGHASWKYPCLGGSSKSSRKRLFKSKPHVIFLDLGTTVELSKSDKRNFKAVALRDGRTAAECTLRLSKQHKCPDPKAFIEIMQRKNFILECFSIQLPLGTPEGDLVHPAKCMQQLVEKVRRHRVNVCTFMVTTLVLEMGILRRYFHDLCNSVQSKQVEQAFAFWGTPEGDLKHPAECMQQLLEKVRRHRVNVDGNVGTHCHGNHFGS